MKAMSQVAPHGNVRYYQVDPRSIRTRKRVSKVRKYIHKLLLDLMFMTVFLAVMVGSVTLMAYCVGWILNNCVT